MTSMGWKSLGVLELTALPSIGRERWVSRIAAVHQQVPWVREADVLDVFPQNTMADAERWAADIAGPGNAIDDQTASEDASCLTYRSVSKQS